MDIFMVFPGVRHLRDEMGVCMTLIEGRDRAMLIDTGYGLHDIKADILRLTDKPLSVYLTHAHHDHALGAGCFDTVHLNEKDMEIYPFYTDEAHRKHVLNGAHGKGLAPDEARFFGLSMAKALPILTQTEELGDMEVRILPCPGHTQGSTMFYIEKYHLLLTGDNWNPCTWLFFPEALGVREYLHNMRCVQKMDFTCCLCSHSEKLHDRAMLDAFLNGLTDDCLKAARPVSITPYEAIDTCEAHPADGQILVFDRQKISQ